ncbi:MAG: peptidoglycan-binding protein [Clostridia bacterium]|jgi:cell wall-associated NlpC family hydrolase
MKKIKKRIVLLIVILIAVMFTSHSVFAAVYIKAGDRGEHVRQMQQRLYELGYPVGDIDGVAGPQTIEAVILFQKMNDLEVDGVVGPATWDVMFSGVEQTDRMLPESGDNDSQAESRANPSEPAPSVGQSVPIQGALRMGSKGHQVALLQSRLNELGYNVGYPDGDFGSRTRNGLMTFQRVNGLTVDGIAGPVTLAKLFGNPKALDTAEYNYSGGSTGEAIVAYAKQFLGVPYVYGGNGPNSFDCSGFTRYVYAHFNITLPRVAADQRAVGYEVSRSELRPGDLILFTSPGSGSGIGHVGIYIGNGEFIHASSGSAMSVCISSLNSSYYTNRYVTARRIVS